MFALSTLLERCAYVGLAREHLIAIFLNPNDCVSPSVNASFRSRSAESLSVAKVGWDSNPADLGELSAEKGRAH